MLRIISYFKDFCERNNIPMVMKPGYMDGKITVAVLEKNKTFVTAWLDYFLPTHMVYHLLTVREEEELKFELLLEELGL